MKQLFFFVFIILAIATKFIKTEDSKCPPSAEIPKECTCYEISERISCTDIKTPFKLLKSYELTTLSIYNTPDLSNLADDTIPSEHKIKVKSLILVQNLLSASKIPTWQILQDVLSISTNSIKIMSDKTGMAADNLDVEHLSTDITSLIIEGIPKLTNFDPLKFTNLKRLQIINTNLDESLSTDLLFLSSSIKYLEFDTTSIVGKFSFNPKSCKADEQIIIKLNNNPTLTIFDFTSLSITKPTLQDCNYHIELNNNRKLDKNLFSKIQVAAIADLNKENSKKLYLVMKNDPTFVCSCDLFKIYSNNKYFIHGITCLTDKIDKEANKKNLSLLEKTDFKTVCNP